MTFLTRRVPILFLILTFFDTFDASDTCQTCLTAYDYLLSMPLWSLTFEKVEKLKKEADAKLHELEALQKTTEKQLWIDDLNLFLDVSDMILFFVCWAHCVTLEKNV